MKNNNSYKVGRPKMSVWVHDATEIMLAEILQEINDVGRHKGINFADSMFTTLIAKLIGVMVYDGLNKREEKSQNMNKEELQKYTIDNYSEVKAKIQEAIAAGFTGAMSSYAGKRVEYYCQVKTIPEPLSNTRN